MREKRNTLKMLVPGDIIHLSSGDMIPADVQLIASKELFVNQSSLTGESLPVEKNITKGTWKSNLENPNLCFMGTNVESGTANAVIAKTGMKTYFGQLSSKITNEREMTSFDKGINDYTWLMIKFILIMAPLVFVINGFTKGNWFEAFLFGIAVAVGLTPEMLPMIVTVNLTKGALSMAKKNVIVKKLNAIQNFGAMDILCTDKTGTITEGKVVLEKHLNMYGDNSERVLKYAFINSFYQTGLRNVMDTAIMAHKNESEDYFDIVKKYLKIDEIPFDFMRKRMSVVVQNKRMEHVLVCKGAVEEVLSLCNKYELKEGTEPFMGKMTGNTESMIRGLNAEGFRVIAVAYRIFQEGKNTYTLKDHVVGFMGDGINDAPALRAADVGISVDTAIDIAKESSDIILLKNNLLVLEEGVLEGRRVFGNIVKYIKMTASSNFGNMFSVLGASIFVPFLPMLPIQVLTNNLLYDISQIAIPTDTVDETWISKPRKWAVEEIKRFVFHIGPISSIFDYTTFFIMLYVFNAWKNPALFQTGWFLESLFTQTIIIHVIRTNKIPFIQSLASTPLMMTSLLIIAIGVILVNSPLAIAFGFTKLPGLYYVFLALTLFCYVALTQIIKVWYIKKYNVE